MDYSLDFQLVAAIPITPSHLFLKKFQKMNINNLIMKCMMKEKQK